MNKYLEKLRDEMAEQNMLGTGSLRDGFRLGFDAASSHLMRVIEVQRDALKWVCRVLPDDSNECNEAIKKADAILNGAEDEAT